MAGLLHASRWGEATSANGDGGSDSFEAEVRFDKAATLPDRGLYAESEYLWLARGDYERG